MAVNVYFFQCNDDYSQAFADQHHEGKESPDNIKYHWEDHIVIKGDIFKISDPIHDSYTLAGEKEGGTFSFEIPGMLKFKLLSDDNSVTEIAVSESIIKDYKVDAKTEHQEIRFYFKDNEVFANPVPGIYIDVADFPKPLQ